VTGSTSGIGYEAALALARAGARVVIAARDEKKGNAAIAAIQRVHPNADLTFRLLDTALLASVRTFVAQWQEDHGPIDILVLNAGIASVPHREETADGFERQLATNYLGHFALAGLLLPHMKSSPGSRFVQVASIAHRRARLYFEDLPGQNAAALDETSAKQGPLRLPRRGQTSPRFTLAIVPWHGSPQSRFSAHEFNA
jgi:NAD(P)-dependent dehydrogenase (short-subunit alcohol dehydrogenase family)